MNDLTGKKFGRLMALEPTEKRKHGCIIWICLCDCGNLIEVRSDELKFKHKKSCGCLRGERARKRGKESINYKHGDSIVKTRKKLYRIWQAIKTRCLNPNHITYYYYGNRNIKICNEWKNDYLAFKTWALSHGYIEGLTIDRINNNGNYEPNNCRWITKSENTRKSCKERYANGEKMKKAVESLVR